MKALVCVLIVSSTASADTLDVSTLVGTWRHQATSKTATGPAKPVSTAKISWVFSTDGKGEYQQTVPSLGMNNTRPFQWTLKGSDILLDGGKIKYTVVKSGGNTMIWKNHLLGDYFHVVKK